MNEKNREDFEEPGGWNNLDDRILNWGLLGTARINRALIDPIRASPRNHLLCVGSRSVEKAQEYAREWQIPEFHGSYEDLLADPNVDVIYNSLPNSLHFPWTIAAADAGKHVLCEKPMGMSPQEIDEMAAAADRNQVVISEAFMYRHHPQTLRVLEIVDAGEIGEVRLVRGYFSFKLTRPGDVRLNSSLGGGSIWDVGCYPISYIRTVFGEEPIEVQGERAPAGSGVDLTFVGQMRFSGDRFGQFDSSFAGPLRSEIEVVGSEGSIRIPNPFKPGRNERIEIRRENRAEIIEMPAAHLYRGEVEDMADAVLLGRSARISLTDSRGNAATIVALLQSAAEKKPIEITHPQSPATAG